MKEKKMEKRRIMFSFFKSVKNVEKIDVFVSKDGNTMFKSSQICTNFLHVEKAWG